MPLKVLVFLALTLCLTSCGSNTILYPLQGTDIYNGTNKGDICFSEFYLKEVAQIKIGKR